LRTPRAKLPLQVKQTLSGRRICIIYRAVILGVPRSGKSRLAGRLAGALELIHYPVDSLVSTFGEVFPEVGIGRQFEDSASTVSLEPFLMRWVRHLDYERVGYVLEGYHIGANAAATLAGQGFRVAALGVQSVDVEQKCREIRKYADKGDWSEGLTDSELSNLVVRYQAESIALKDECEKLGLAYFEMGSSTDADLDAVLKQLSGAER